MCSAINNCFEIPPKPDIDEVTGSQGNQVSSFCLELELFGLEKTHC